MKWKRFLVGVLSGAVALSSVQTVSYAAAVAGEGSASADTDFDTSGLFNKDLIVMIPDEVPLTLNQGTKKFEGKGFVTAWGKASARARLDVSTDKEITYAHEDDSSIVAQAAVEFGDAETNTASWDAKTLNENVSAAQKAGEYVDASVPLSQVDNIGVYNSKILFNISLDAKSGTTYYMGYKYVSAKSYTKNDDSIPYEMMESGDTVAELQAFSTDRAELESAGYDKIVASTDTDLEVPAQVDGLDVVGVSFDTFFADDAIGTYVKTVTLPESVEGIELTAAQGSQSQTVITSYNFRTSVKLSKIMPENAKIRFVFQDTDWFNYEKRTYNGVEGYGVNGFSPYGFYQLENSTDGNVTIQLPDTYKDKPVLDFLQTSTGSGGKRVLFDRLSELDNIQDVTLAFGANTKRILGWWDANSRKDMKITNVVLNDGLEEIYTDAFRGITSITSVEIPATVKTVGDSAFYGCTSLEKVTFAEGFSGEIENGAFSNIAAAEMSFPSSVKGISMDAFGSSLNVSKTVRLKFDNAFADVTVKKGRAHYLEFSDCGYIADSYYAAKTPKGLLNAEGNFEFVSDEMTASATDNYIGNAMKCFAEDNAGMGKVILAEGVTELPFSLQGCAVKLPGTLTAISARSGCLNSCTIEGSLDLRGMALPSGFGISKSGIDSLTLKSSQLGMLGGKTINDDSSCRIGAMYISYDSPLKYTHRMSFSGIGAVYFSGSEEEWNANVVPTLGNWSEFTGEIHYNASF